MTGDFEMPFHRALIGHSPMIQHSHWLILMMVSIEVVYLVVMAVERLEGMLGTVVGGILGIVDADGEGLQEEVVKKVMKEAVEDVVEDVMDRINVVAVDDTVVEQQQLSWHYGTSVSG